MEPDCVAWRGGGGARCKSAISTAHTQTVLCKESSSIELRHGGQMSLYVFVLRWKVSPSGHKSFTMSRVSRYKTCVWAQHRAHTKPRLKHTQFEIIPGRLYFQHRYQNIFTSTSVAQLTLPKILQKQTNTFNTNAYNLTSYLNCGIMSKMGCLTWIFLKSRLF